jgi:hypothetical protein
MAIVINRVKDAPVINSVKDAPFISAIARALQPYDIKRNFAAVEVLRALLEMPLPVREQLALRLCEKRTD